jgi:hypothetical protein
MSPISEFRKVLVDFYKSNKKYTSTSYLSFYADTWEVYHFLNKLGYTNLTGFKQKIINQMRDLNKKMVLLPEDKRIKFLESLKPSDFVKLGTTAPKKPKDTSPKKPKATSPKKSKAKMIIDNLPNITALRKLSKAALTKLCTEHTKFKCPPKATNAILVKTIAPYIEFTRARKR